MGVNIQRSVCRTMGQQFYLDAIRYKCEAPGQHRNGSTKRRVTIPVTSGEAIKLGSFLTGV